MLSEKEIEILYAYCETKGVRYYDVQAELVDHLADAIEKLQKQKPSLSFRELISEVDTQFAPDEFVMITKNKSVVIRKKYFNLYKEELFSFVRIPKLFLLILLYSLMFLFRDYTHDFYLPILQTLPLLFALNFFIWKRRLKLDFGANIFDSRLSLISLRLVRWVTTRIIVIIYIPFAVLYTFLHIKEYDQYPNFFTALYPLFIVAYMSAVNIQYKIRYQIIADYPEAFA
jgi:hypothetical protein